jgi:hypothetical protein
MLFWLRLRRDGVFRETSMDRFVRVGCLGGVLILAACAGSPARAPGFHTPDTLPYKNVPHAVPGIVEAKHFDEGAEGEAYHYLDAKNEGAPYRQTGVDIEPRGDASNGYGVGWTRPGEWLVYTIEVTEAGTYAIEMPVASPGQGGTFHLEFNGIDKTGPIQVPDTGSWQKLQVVRKDGVRLEKGRQTMRMVMVSPGTHGGICDIDCFRFKLFSP